MAGIHPRLTLVHVSGAGTRRSRRGISIRPRPSLIADTNITGGVGGLDAGSVLPAQLRGSNAQAGVPSYSTVSAAEAVPANTTVTGTKFKFLWSRRGCHQTHLKLPGVLMHWPLFRQPAKSVPANSEHSFTSSSQVGPSNIRNNIFKYGFMILLKTET